MIGHSAAQTPQSPRFELVYDVASSDAARYAFGLCLAAVVLFVLWAAWLRARDAPLHVGVKFVAVIALLLLALGLGLRLEQRKLAARTDTRTVEGAITGLWADRVRRGSSQFYWEWEGFSVKDVPFAYARNVEQNYFHNGGSGSLALRDGLRVRIRYIEERDGDEVRNHILRMERAVD